MCCDGLEKRRMRPKGATADTSRRVWRKGKRPDLVGGGLVRSMGGSPEVLSLRRSQEEVLSDERILGSGKFVERLLRDADEKMKQRLRGDALRQRAEDVIRKACKKEGVKETELKSGGRRGAMSEVKSNLEPDGFDAKRRTYPSLRSIRS